MFRIGPGHRRFGLHVVIWTQSALFSSGHQGQCWHVPSDATARFMASIGLNTMRFAAKWRTVLMTGTGLER